jgi:hypothetical protein
MPSKRFREAAHSPTHVLLLLLARMQASAANDDKVRALIASSPPDWDALLMLANMHGVLTVCHRTLMRISPQAMPAEIQVRLQRTAMNTAMRNLEMTNALLQLSVALENAGVQMITYKGPTLSALAYGGVGGRQFSDLDVIVPPHQLVQAKQVLMDIGYTPFHDPEHREDQKEDHDRSYQGYDMISADQRVAVDLQMRFGLRSSSFHLPFETLWAQRRQVYFGDRAVNIPSPEDYMLALCAHGTQHRWARLKWVCDLAELGRVAADIDWAAVLRRADAMGIARMVHVGLLLAHEALDMPLPDTIRDRALNDERALRLALATFRWMFVEARGTWMLIRRAQFDYAFDLALRPRLRDQIAVTLFLTRRRLFPRSEPQPQS